MTLLIRQIEPQELPAYVAAGWGTWPPPGTVGVPVPSDPKTVTVALYVPPSLTHQDLMRISKAPLRGLAALEVEDTKGEEA